MPDELKLQELRLRLRRGDILKRCGIENDNYMVHLTDDPPMSFDVSDRENVVRVLHELNQI